MKRRRSAEASQPLVTREEQAVERLAAGLGISIPDLVGAVLDLVRNGLRLTCPAAAAVVAAAPEL